MYRRRATKKAVLSPEEPKSVTHDANALGTPKFASTVSQTGVRSIYAQDLAECSTSPSTKQARTGVSNHSQLATEHDAIWEEYKTSGPLSIEQRPDLVPDFSMDWIDFSDIGLFPDHSTGTSISDQNSSQGWSIHLRPRTDIHSIVERGSHQ